MKTSYTNVLNTVKHIMSTGYNNVHDTALNSADCTNWSIEIRPFSQLGLNL